MFNVSTEQIEETKRLQKESQSEVVLLQGTHACTTYGTLCAITDKQIEKYSHTVNILASLQKKKKLTVTNLSGSVHTKTQRFFTIF